VERTPRERKIAKAVNRICRPQGVASKKPRISRTRRIARFVIACNHADLVLVLDLQLVDSDFSPRKRVIHLAIWRLRNCAMSKKVRVVVLRPRIQRGKRGVDSRGLLIGLLAG